MRQCLFHAIMQQKKGNHAKEGITSGDIRSKEAQSRHTGVNRALYLKTLPSANSMVLPLTTTGLSHAHMSSTNSLSSALVGSSLVKV